jgi:hypothetical protein
VSPLAEGTSILWVVEVPDGLGEPLVVIISGATDDWDSWLSDLHSTAESLQTP